MWVAADQESRSCDEILTSLEEQIAETEALRTNLQSRSLFWDGYCGLLKVGEEDSVRLGSMSHALLDDKPKTNNVSSAVSTPATSPNKDHIPKDQTSQDLLARALEEHDRDEESLRKPQLRRLLTAALDRCLLSQRALADEIIHLMIGKFRNIDMEVRESSFWSETEEEVEKAFEWLDRGEVRRALQQLHYAENRATEPQAKTIDLYRRWISSAVRHV